MVTDGIRTGLIYGSVQGDRFCNRVASWAGGEIWQRRGFSLQVIDPARQADPSGQRPGDTELKHRLTRADAFVIVTPAYNHDFGSGLKAFIDSATSVWQAKPVGFVSYGGISSGSRAVEQLRRVLSQRRAVTLWETVSFDRPQYCFDHEGNLSEAAASEAAMNRLLGQLEWWAQTLKPARQAAASTSA